jgi:hypothetical protein
MDLQEMALALGILLFQTSFCLPAYPDGEWGNWLYIDHGYYTRQRLISGMPMLMRRKLQNPGA